MSDKRQWDKILKPDTKIHRRGKKYRYRCRDGHWVQSLWERKIDNWLYLKGIKHDLYPQLPGTNFKADWKVGDIYIY